MTPSFANLLRNPVHLLAFGLGSGLAPKVPGTAGTIVAALFLWLLSPLAAWQHLILVATATGIGVQICGRTARDLDQHDHPGIVWDEFAGFWLAMFMAPAGIAWLLTGVLLFRLFDIWKPWPIDWLDAKVGGGWGIMLDDLLAGVYTALVMVLLRNLLI